MLYLGLKSLRLVIIYFFSSSLFYGFGMYEWYYVLSWNMSICSFQWIDELCFIKFIFFTLFYSLFTRSPRVYVVHIQATI